MLLFAALTACADGREDSSGASAYDASEDNAATPEVQALADSLTPALERLSGLTARSRFTIRSQNQAAVRAYVMQRLAEELPAEELASVRDTYALLGLIPDTLDLHALLLDLYAEQVMGYYDPASKTMYVLAGAAPGTLRPVLAHELVHALQDQHTDVDSLISSDRGTDRQAAAHAALEGHATLVMFALLAEAVELRELDPADLPNPAAQLRQGLESPDNEFPVFERAPAIIRETLMFPYVGGADFVHSVWSADTGAHKAPILAELPQSTEQILHPKEKFVAVRDAPTDVAFESNAVPGWRIRREDAFGELETGILLSHYLGAAARDQARGWDGDRYRMLENEKGQRVFVWHSVWDGAQLADRFAAAIRRVAAKRAGRDMVAERVELGGRPAVMVIDAPTGEAAAARAAARSMKVRITSTQ